MQYTEIFKVVKNENGFNEYPQSIFGAKIRKMGKSLHTPVLLYKIEGVHISRTCFPDDMLQQELYGFRHRRLSRLDSMVLGAVGRGFAPVMQYHSNQRLSCLALNILRQSLASLFFLWKIGNCAKCLILLKYRDVYYY